MEEVATKLYEATQDFTMAKYTPEGNPDGEVSYTAGTRYQMPAEVAALAPEGALKEVEEVPPTPPAEPTGTGEASTLTPPTSATGTPPVVAPTETAPAEQPKSWVGHHTMTDDGSEGMRRKKGV